MWLGRQDSPPTEPWVWPKGSRKWKEKGGWKTKRLIILYLVIEIPRLDFCSNNGCFNAQKSEWKSVEKLVFNKNKKKWQNSKTNSILNSLRCKRLVFQSRHSYHGAYELACNMNVNKSTKVILGTNNELFCWFLNVHVPSCTICYINTARQWYLGYYSWLLRHTELFSV